ncbi:zinc finger protein 425 [Nilaparvata lugens]|uniref:zinc finger protein 425 n=1 Tax=Nilaparvata lugens TaxID=108931 RepID=UPI00193E7643|nr:zinc finger protein 425 [Nilaparvata lugens]
MISSIIHYTIQLPVTKGGLKSSGDCDLKPFFTTTKRGFPKLMLDGFFYNRYRTTANCRTNWRCDHIGCYASVTTETDVSEDYGFPRHYISYLFDNRGSEESSSQSGAESQRFVCVRCKKQYKYECSLKRHLKFECGHLPKFTCSKCGYSTKRHHNLLRHIKTTKHLSVLNKIICPRCGKSYKYHSSLDRHLKYECGVEPRFKCPICDHVTKHKSNFSSAFTSAKHFESQLGSQRIVRHSSSALVSLGPDDQHPFVCDRCNRSYKYQAGLSSHKRFECGRQPQFNCPHCAFSSKLKGNLKKHIALHFSSAFTSAKHFESQLGSQRIVRHSNSALVSLGPDDQHPFVCDRCNRSYKYQAGLSSHKRFECGRQPQFNCPHCAFSSKLKGNLKKHIALRHITKFYYLKSSNKLNVGFYQR